jgi:hypothetical protein
MVNIVMPALTIFKTILRSVGLLLRILVPYMDNIRFLQFGCVIVHVKNHAEINH